MDERQFGTTALRVSALGLGCARIGGIFQRDSKSFVDLLAAAKDRGINFFDTADMYSQGESEALIGRTFQRRRDRIVIATKVGYCLPAQRKLIARIKPIVRPLIRLLKIRRDQLPQGVRGEVKQDFSPGYITSAVEGNLKRLRTDYLDILQLHAPPAEIVARGEWLSALENLKKSGKIRYYGISCDTVEAAQAVLAYPGVSSLQVVVSLLEQGAVTEILPGAQAKGVGVIARECLANGLLVKNEGEFDLKAYVQSPEQEALRIEQLARYRDEARSKKVPLARLALDYVSTLPGVSVTLIGVRNFEQLNSLLRVYAG
jgi:aryl-alcohol dehydrogenase-like predicted oxidoreductase